MDPSRQWLAELSQIPLTASDVTIASICNSPWLDSLLIPAYIADASALLLLVQYVSQLVSKQKSTSDGSAGAEESVNTVASRPYFRQKLEDVGGITIFLSRLAQLLAVLGLLGISVAQLLMNTREHADNLPFDAQSIVQLIQCVLYVYLSALSLTSLLGNTRLGLRAYYHATWILVSVWSVYMYRDVWPLATTDLVLVDNSEGSLLWVKVGLLTLASAIIPVFVPRKYIPVDPKDPLGPNPEQTVSLWSLLTYTFITPIVWLAYRIPHLPFEKFPPLADYDHLKNMSGYSFAHLDPLQSRSRRHLGLKLIGVFWVEFCHLAAAAVIGVIGAFAAPISINNLLAYLEVGGAGKTIKPWFWITLLFSGRVLQSISDQWFMLKNTRVTIRVQAIVTELVFEHALRIRMKADIDDSAADLATSGEDIAVATSDTASQDPQEESGAQSSEDETATANASTHTATSSWATAVAPASASKGKGKVAPDAAPAKPAESAKEALEKKGGKNLVGRINNLVTSDLSSLENLPMALTFATFESPFQIILCITFLYQILGWSAIVGLAAMLLSLPVPGYITKLLQGTQREKMKRTDARVQLVTEMMNVIRMIKLFGWESRIASQLNKRREEELVAVRRIRILALTNQLCNFLLPILVMLSTFFTYAVIMKGTLTASKVFSAMSVFDMLRMDIQATFYTIPTIIQAKVAVERLQEFLEKTELIDEFTAPEDPDSAMILSSTVPDAYKDSIAVRQASFTWANDSALVAVTPGGPRKRTFVLRVEDDVVFRRGKLNIIVGPTGAGKTSLLMALLGEMHYIPAGPDSFVSLPRAGGVAYAAQESWVQNETIKNNIIFEAPYDEVRYTQVLEQCALKRDLELFEAGDQTEVGEKGITLSGGQKARITLARAVYSSAEIVLLDDILAALDVHTSRWIVEKCLKGDLLTGRTIILVTHNVVMVSPIADFVVDMGSDGRILSQGSLSSALARDSKLLQEVQEEQQELEKAVQEVDAEKPEDAVAKQSTGKLVIAEELNTGHVGLSAMLLFLGSMSKRPVLFWLVYSSGQVLRHLTTNIQIWYLGVWATQYELYPPEEVSAAHYLGVYSLTVLGVMVATAFCVIYFVYGSLRAARIIHQDLVTSILTTTLRWLDKTPTSRIIARCTEDIQTLDNKIARASELFIEIFIFLILKMVAVVAFTPIFIFPALVVALVGGIVGNIFMMSQLSVKREMSNAKAPVLGHFGAAVSGITSIRAYGVQEPFKKESFKRIDNYTRASIVNLNLNLWMTLRIETMGTLFTTCLAIYLTYISPLSAANTGFSLAMASSFSNNIFSCVRMFNEFETSGNSLERIQQYLQIEHEPESTPEGQPPAYWPASGKLEVEGLSAKYSVDGPKVLHDVSFEVAPGERIGIVGRTGSGKSSLTLSLLRCILTEGKVRYDGIATDSINLDALRSNITIIPQVPELLSGTLRQNLDPFSEHDDAVLNDALRSAGLFNLQDENDDSRITLDSQIAGGGANLSVGQRQILALARAIVRRSKLLILDEATSAIDYETDSIIQTSLRTELDKDVTLLTVAHRLQTIMDADKIMVLDAGRIAEFGKPSELLKNENGMLRALVDESGDREKLCTMANAARASDA